MERDIQLDWARIVKEAIKRRKESRLTQEQVAVLANVSKPTVVHFEKCKQSITLKSAFAILSLFGLISSPEETNF